MHRYIVLSMTNRGKYTATGFIHKSQAEAHLAVIVRDARTYDARVIDLD